MERLDTTGYLAQPERLEQLLGELANVSAVHGSLVLADGPPQQTRWAQNVWLEPYLLSVGSISDAVHQLCALQRNWWPYAFQLHRRSELTRQRLPHVTARPLEFPEPAPVAALGSFTWLDASTVLCSPACSSPFPNGEASFVEFGEQEGPPSRAYLKLFEALTLLGRHPRAGERCLEIGASPGGWTWVLATLGARVIAVDRARLAPNVRRLENVDERPGNAFNATPDTIGPVAWLFSDVICYPEKLYHYIEGWLSSGACRNFVCTLKFQGDSHYGVIDRFEAIPGSRIVHLSHNRHELCWMRTEE